ncbi:MAG: RNA polymerase sigma factor [Agriterribacter sp.]
MKLRLITDLYNNGELKASILKYADNNKHLAADIKQELFLILLNKDENYFYQHLKSDSLLFSALAIAKNISVNHYREQAKKVNAVPDNIEDESNLNFLAAARNVFPEELRKVYHFDRKLLRQALKGKSAKQIAEHYVINKDYVRRALHRGKLELGERIQNKIKDFEVLKFPVVKKRCPHDGLEILNQIELIA